MLGRERSKPNTYPTTSRQTPEKIKLESELNRIKRLNEVKLPNNKKKCSSKSGIDLSFVIHMISLFQR